MQIKLALIFIVVLIIFFAIIGRIAHIRNKSERKYKRNRDSKQFAHDKTYKVNWLKALRSKNKKADKARQKRKKK